MRGRKPKERDSYILRMADGTLVEVGREIYLEWYQARRREKYQNERNRKYGVCSLNELEEKGNFLSAFIDVKEGVEEIILRDIFRNKVQEVLKSLPAEDVRLVELLYYAEVTLTDAARIFGCSRRTIQNRKKRILDELCQKMKQQGIQGGYF
ncbi:sigma-70 family RNA polymerase sigma factor [Lachnospiraceae bacterium M18-1]|nr:sigma-70 family RNA polymerase sigma factor [Lachnospiraceae bacterium M18-1]